MTQSLTAWTEMPVRNIDAAVAFYDAVLGTKSKIDRSGPRPMANIDDHMSGVGCTLFEGEPTSGAVIHFYVASMEAAAKKAEAAGGKVDSDPVEIPYGRFVYATDPDGNRLGLFEAKG